MRFQHPPAGTAANPVMMIVGPILLIAFLIGLVLLGRYIYKDAMRRSLNAEMWLLIALMAPVISWVIYFLVRKDATMARSAGSLSEAAK